MKYAITIATLLALLDPANAHTWLEQMQVIDSATGNFTGDYGYARGYVARTDPTFNGNSDDYLLPPLVSGRTRINGSDLLCHPAQRTANYSSAYPRLSVTSGGWVAMKYLENGHVTLPQNQLGKPKAAGTVFVYGTTSPSSTERIADVLEWTSDGSGGDKRGSLLTAQTFDDGRCHELNSGTLSTQRQQEFPDPNPGQPTSKMPLWCETDLQIPTTSETGETLTLYWVWQWPTEAGADPTYPTGKDEYYTSCADVDVVDSISDAKPVHTLVQQDPMASADSTFKSRTAYTTSPSVTLAGATGVTYASTTSAAAATSGAGKSLSSSASFMPSNSLLTSSTEAPNAATSAAGGATSIAAQVTVTVTDMVTVTAPASTSTPSRNTTVTQFDTTMVTATSYPSSWASYSSSTSSSSTTSSFSSSSSSSSTTSSSATSSSATSSSSTSSPTSTTNISTSQPLSAAGSTARSMALPYITIIPASVITSTVVPSSTAAAAAARLRKIRHVARHGARYRV